MDTKPNSQNLKANNQPTPIQTLLPISAIYHASGGNIPGKVTSDPGLDDQGKHYVTFTPDPEMQAKGFPEGPVLTEEIEPTTRRDAALWYAAAYGWPVIPLHTPTGKPDNPCSCNRKRCKDFGQHPCHDKKCDQKGKHPCHWDVCADVGKHPRTMNGLKDATTDPKKINHWWDMWTNANVGLVTGTVSGFFALDVDPRKGGKKSLSDLESQHKKRLPKTKTVKTGGDGLHYLFKHPGSKIKNSVSEIGPGLDIRGDGGYIVAAPSLHVSGNKYQWLNGVELGDAPQWLLDEMCKPDQVKKKSAGPIGDKIPDGQRNNTLTSLAGTMRRRGMSVDAIDAALQAENTARCDPPLSASDVRKIAESVSRYAPTPDIDLGPSPEPPEWMNDAPKPEWWDQGTPAKNAGGDASKVEVLEKPLAHWPAPLGEAAYYGLTGEIVTRIKPHTEADPAALKLQFLTEFGNVIGRSAHFKVEADLHYLNLNTVLVGGTSKGRKGTSQGHIKNQIGKLDAQWLACCVQSGLSSGEGLIWAVRDQIEGREPIKERGRTVDYATVVVDEGVSDKRLLVYEPEYARTLAMASRDSNVLSAVIRQAWDDGNLSTMTKNSPARATGAHISIIGHITKDELLRLLDKTEAANGFGNRHLWVCVRRSKVLPEGGQLDKVDFSDLDQQLTKAFDFARTAGEMKRDDEARALWISRYEDLSDGKPGLLGAMTARAEAQVMRLACLYALLDCSETIRKPHLEAALEVWRYCEDSARFVFGDTMGDPIADSILINLNEAGEQGMTRTQLNALFKGHATSSAIGRALGMLAEIGKVGSRKEPTDGRPVEYWFLTNTNCEKSEKSEIRVLKATVGVS